MIEYIVSQEYARKVVTEESSFSFERGMEEILGIHWMRHIHGGTFFRDVDSIVGELSTKKLRTIAKETWPVFELGVSELLDTVQDEKPIDILQHVKRIMAQATICILLGPTYQNDEDVNRILNISADVAELMGLRRHESRMARKFPRLWRTLTLTKMVLIRLPLDIGPVFARRLWADISSREKRRDPEDETIFSHLVDRYASTSGSVSFLSKLWITILILTVIFGSVHQTAVIIVWVTYFLALHPDCQKSLRDEAESLVRSGMSGSGSEYKALQNAILADSFVREVLRMKGDAVNAVRVAVRDVELAGHRIPKGTPVFPVTYLSNRSPDLISNPDKFDAERWIGTGKSATTTGQDYLAFGLGRWSCPGRFLAVMEIKAWILALVRQADFELHGGRYKVVDAYNITAVPPQGYLLMKRRAGY